MKIMKFISKLSILCCLILNFSMQNVHAQAPTPGALNNIEDDDLNIGGDIFSDFNESLDEAQVVEDERFYRYGRFFSFSILLGITTFDGNRGAAYENDPPTFGLSINWFTDFQTSFGLGFEYSKHHMFFGEQTEGFKPDPVGFIDVNMLRVFLAYRYYIETSNLGTAVTYSNPYFTGRMEYWYVTNKFVDQSELANDTGGGFGFGAGFGLEFPIKLKESYLGVEFLFHTVNFHDKFTQSYASVEGGSGGFEDLSGNVYSTVLSYVVSW
ncbi:MAG: hypothetical protein KC493_07340 [Bacteriovoracaceae bacterium]|nr:hypothetical protein [Bacteriovoracaceae bacterium]